MALLGARCAALALAAAFAGTAAASTEEAFSREDFLIRVTIHDAAIEVPRLARQHVDIAGVDPKRGFVDVVGDRGTYDLLHALGFDVVIERPLPSEPESVAALSDYRTPAETNATLDALVAAHPGLATKIQYATTGGGRPVWALKISDNVATEEDEPAIFFVAQHHAREVMTPEIALDVADYLLSRYATDPQVAAWVDGLEIFVLPNHNPDGTDYVFTNDTNWRKNRRPNGDGTFGVDPNRNYPFKWGACGGSSGLTSDETYRGPSPASEPETFQGILELARDQRPVISLSYHTYSELVIMPFGCTGSHTSERETFRYFASGLSTSLVTDDGLYRYAAGAAWEILYPVDGEMNDWFYAELGTYPLTIEANSSAQGFQPDYATWRNSTVLRNRPGWQYLLDRVDRGPSIRGHVTDACTGAPLEATVSLDEVFFANGETPRTSEPGFGRYQWLTPPDVTRHVRVVEPGYTSQVWSVDVGIDPVDRPIHLVPAGSNAVAVVESWLDDAAGDGDGQADPGETTGLVIRLANTGGAPLSGVGATISTTDPWVTVVDGAASYGTLGSGEVGDGDGFGLEIDPAAPDGHEAVITIALAAAQPLCDASATVTVHVTIGAPSCPFTGEALDANPGWVIENTGAGGWAFGVPMGNGGSTGPSAAFTGTNVFGTNLAGNYGNNGNFLLTTGPYDLRGLRHAELRFMRWLDNEPGYDLASAEISIDGGFNWSSLWSAFGYGEGWQPERLDIAALADQEEDVRFRFRLTSDGGVTEPGFYIDDLAVCGEAVLTSAGKLKYESLVLDDSAPSGGNANGTLDAGETVGLAVTLRSNRDAVATGVEAFLSSTTPGVVVRNGYAEFPSVPAGGAAASLAPGFSFSVDESACGQTIGFVLDIRWDGGAATSSFSVGVGTERTTMVLVDQLETDLGWTAGSEGATAGYFVREDPWGVVDAQSVAVQPEDDTTGAPGVRAWVTGNPQPHGNFNPLSGDVDKGTVWVQSPTFDGTNALALTLELKRWFVRRNPGPFDTSEGRLRVSRDNGGSWVTMIQYTGDTPQWVVETLDLATFVQPSAQMKVRFEVQERLQISADTLVEGLVDDVQVARRRIECDPFSPPPALAPHGVGDTVTVSKSSSHLATSWSAPPVDAGHGAATGYTIHSSPAPSGGFVPTLTPTSPAAVFVDDLLDAASRFLLVVAENSGGSSPDVPAP